MEPPRTILLQASSNCLAMIMGYYDLPSYPTDSSARLDKLREEGIPLGRVVTQHWQLLRIDRAMQDDKHALDTDLLELSTRWQFEETTGLLQKLARCNVRLRHYGLHFCPPCNTRHTRSDVRVLRVWPKSVTVSCRIGEHSPQPVRLKPTLDGLRDKANNCRLSLDHVYSMADRLREFEGALRDALPLLPELFDYVVAYTGLQTIAVDYRVLLDTD